MLALPHDRFMGLFTVNRFARNGAATYDAAPLAKKRPTPAPDRAEPHGSGAERIERLIDAVEEVAAQIEVLRQVIDEIREEFQWAVRNNRMAPHVVRVTSMAKDPLDPEWAAKLNRLTPADFPPSALDEAPDEDETDGQPAAEPEKQNRQRTLWQD